MNITLVVTTYNRAALLRRALASVAASVGIPPDTELVIVDNNSRDDTRAAAQAFIDAGPPLPCRYVFEPQQGVSHARNAGLREARGHYLAYMDDEQEICPHYLSRLGAAFERSGADCVGGRIVYRNAEHLPVWLQPLIDRIGQIDLGDEMRPLGAGDPYLKGGNMAFITSALKAAGGFDARLGRVGTNLLAGEEDAAQDALRRLGYRVAYCPELMQYNVLLPQKLHKRYWRGQAYWGGRSEFQRSQGLWRGAPTVFGVPRSLIRTLCVNLASWAAAGVGGGEASRFQRERDVWGTLGAIREARALGVPGRVPRADHGS